MQPTTTPEASADERRAHLPTPAIAEASRTELGDQLANYLLPLTAYCERQEADPDQFSLAEFEHARRIREAIDALLRYDAATDTLLERYRQALAAARPVPSLEQAMLGQLTPAELLAHREADPVYRLGFVRGHRKGCADTERKYERLTSLYAQYALLVPPPGYTPSPLAERLSAYLASPALQGYAALPLATRQALNTLTPADLHAHVTRQ